MSAIVISPNMNLPVPVVGQEPGPDYANDVNNCMGAIDSHNHSFGQGVQITPTGLNINTDLTFNSNNALALRSVRFIPQASPLSDIDDIGCIYESGVDLWYNDGLGNQVRITASGGVAGSPGSISGLASPASASYNPGTSTFVWQSNTNTSANMDMGSIIIRDVTANSNGITISAPNSLAADYTLTLPASLPSVTTPLSVDNSGNITTAQITTSSIADGSVTVAKMAAPNMVISGSSGTFNYANSSTFITVTNFSSTLTTVGKPVTITFQPDGTTNISQFGYQDGSINPVNQVNYRIRRNGTPIALYTLIDNVDTVYPGTSYISFIDVPSAGTYTYDLQVSLATGTTLAVVEYCVMVVREL